MKIDSGQATSRMGGIQQDQKQRTQEFGEDNCFQPNGKKQFFTRLETDLQGCK